MPIAGIRLLPVKELRPHFLDPSGRVQMELDPPGDVFGVISPLGLGRSDHTSRGLVGGGSLYEGLERVWTGRSPRSDPELGRTEPGQAAAVACQVSLIGVAGIEGGSGKIAGLAGNEPLQAYYTL